VTRQGAPRPDRAARLAWVLPAAATVLLAGAAVASAHDQAWLDGPPAWRHALRPAASWTLPVLAVLWAGALALYWWPRRHHRLPISLVALLSMVIVGVILAEASFLPCAGGEPSAPSATPSSARVTSGWTGTAGRGPARFGPGGSANPPPWSRWRARPRPRPGTGSSRGRAGNAGRSRPASSSAATSPVPASRRRPVRKVPGPVRPAGISHRDQSPGARSPGGEPAAQPDRVRPINHTGHRSASQRHAGRGPRLPARPGRACRP
jgi:hypothetical protein